MKENPHLEIALIQAKLDDAISLLQDGIRIHDKWFSTPGDMIRAGEAIDSARLFLQANGEECGWGGYGEKAAAFARHGKRVNGEPLQDGDWTK